VNAGPGAPEGEWGGLNLAWEPKFRVWLREKVGRRHDLGLSEQLRVVEDPGLFDCVPASLHPGPPALQPCPPPLDAACCAC
jgi:hypothetical protein